MENIQIENTSYLELSESALIANLKFLRSSYDKQTKLSCVVKGNAYGHGIREFAPLLVKHGVKHFSVFSSYEAFQVKNAIGNSKTDIMIMGDIPENHLDAVIESAMEFFVFDLYRLELAARRAKALGKRAKIHLEVETGMNRLGLGSNELAQAAQIIKRDGNSVDVVGVCTHFAGAESASNRQRVQGQIKRFDQAIKLLKDAGIEPKLRHCACSAAALRFPSTQMDMIRIGIMAYGYWPSEEMMLEHLNEKQGRLNPLRRVLSWKTRVMAIKEVEAGEFIGYGSSYMASEKKKLALLPVGYGNGFPRSLSNNGQVVIRGKRLQVIGTVNMNAITVDATPCEKIKVGDCAALIGEDGDAYVGAVSFADVANQLNYEVLARLPESLRRTVVD